MANATASVSDGLELLSSIIAERYSNPSEAENSIRVLSGI